MNASISFHQTKSIKAEAVTGTGGCSEWVDFTFTDTCGQEFEFTAFCVRKGDAQIYADAINQAFSVVEPPAVEENHQNPCDGYSGGADIWPPISLINQTE